MNIIVLYIYIYIYIYIYNGVYRSINRYTTKLFGGCKAEKAMMMRG